MRTIVLMIAITASLILAGCDDPLGMTDRQSIRANAYVEAARVQADAQKAIAEQETVRTGIWASMVIPSLLIVAGGVVVALVVNWQGRIWFARTQAQGWTPTPQAPPALPRQPERRQLRELRLLAQQQGYEVEVVDSVAYLVDDQGNRVGRRLLTGG